MKILFNYATRSRRSFFLRGIDSILNNLSNTNDYHILIKVDSDDASMFPLPVIKGNHSYCVGKSNSKIHAINRGMETITDWDVVINMSDDVVFTEKGFDDIIRAEFTCTNALKNFELNQVFHYPDGNRSDLLTVSIIGRDYYERDKYIYHPDYVSLFCDNEAMEVAQQRGCYKFVDKVIFNHLHPAYGKAHLDHQYQHTESFSYIDSQTYARRKQINFGL